MTSRLICLIWGHAVDNRVFAEAGRACTRCGKTCLRDDPTPVRIGHTLSCFLSHHTYEPVGTRDGHMEYACLQCGHPLLFPHDADPYSSRGRFQKRVRYLCGVLGHDVHRVGERHGGVDTPVTAATASSISRTDGRWSATHYRACCWATGSRSSVPEARSANTPA